MAGAIDNLPEAVSADAGQYVILEDLATGQQYKILASNLAPAADVDLTALSGLDTTGLVARTGAAFYTTRALAGTANEIAVANSDGVAGNPTLALAGLCESISDLSTNGLVARTAATTATARTITGTANQIIVANGSGVSGNPTLSAPQNIATTSTPQFARLGVGTAADATFPLNLSTNSINSIRIVLPTGALDRTYHYTSTTGSGGATAVQTFGVNNAAGYALTYDISGYCSAVTGTPPNGTVVGNVFRYIIHTMARAAGGTVTFVGTSTALAAKDTNLTNPSLSSGSGSVLLTLNGDYTNASNYAQIDWTVRLTTLRYPTGT